MSLNKRPILSLGGLLKPEEDRPFTLATYDLQLPCRRFDIEHKVAVVGGVSLTAEFLLRLLKSADGIEEAVAAKFFGFDRRDMAFVLAEVEDLGYVDRREGRLWLSFAGMSLFQPGSDEPQIFQVEARRESVGFDLLSIAPEQPRPLDDFDLRLPELHLLQPEVASRAANRVPDAFRRFYSEIASRRDRQAGDRRTLYSIDAVSPGDRFSSLVRVAVRSTGLRPWIGEPDLGDWRIETEQEDRTEVLDAASAFIDELSVDQRSDDREAYDVLASLAPDFFKEFIRRDGLAIDRYYREAFTRVGEVRADRPTIPLVGSILNRENIRKVTEVLAYGLRPPHRSSVLLWAAPMMPAWGATRLLPELLRQLKGQMKESPGSEGIDAIAAVGLITGKATHYVERAFDHVATCNTPQFPRTLELLVIPNVMAAAAVHAPIGAGRGFPTPLGFMSYDPIVIRRAQDHMAECAEPFLRGRFYRDRIMAELAGDREADEADVVSAELSAIGGD